MGSFSLNYLVVCWVRKVGAIGVAWRFADVVLAANELEAYHALVHKWCDTYEFMGTDGCYHTT